ncbi:DUF998 domain-containing protein [uncultured Sulfitobacter sp.]|uniref:DUF998 domain-containing protein n=1 Tax=uncultured Sulfitobacter sp. TaxID=191468 RepID=UPI0026129DF8|nr:DUF998 domain-containing protein [uncultured Sulfitobacter sp.]
MKDLEMECRSTLIRVLGIYAILGCAAFVTSIFIADFIVPDHDWMADTISDLGAGKYEFIVDIGIYAFSGALISIALLSAHLHLGGKRWSVGVVGFAVLGLIVFLVGARNEYGDSDNEGIVIHRYLVYAIGALLMALPLLMMDGAKRISDIYRPVFIAIAVVWTVSAPVFFFLPDGIDGIYERYLGAIAIFFVCCMAHLFLRLASK